MIDFLRRLTTILLRQNQKNTTRLRSSLYVKRGDIIMVGSQARTQNDPAYYIQVMNTFLQKVGEIVGIYSSLFGEIDTWDDTAFPTGERYFWEHIEIMTTNRVYTAPEGRELIILRPHNYIDSDYYVDMDAVIEKQQLNYKWNLPLVPAFLHFLRWAADGGIPDFPRDVYDMWLKAYNIDFRNIPLPDKIHYSPCECTDIALPEFWNRTTGCSPLTMWCLAYGWYKGAGGEYVRELFLNRRDNINAIDAMSPGQVGKFLYDLKTVTIISSVE